MGQDTQGVVADSVAAQSKGMKTFDISLEDLMQTVNLYKSRTFDEDLEFVKQNLGGVESIVQRLKVDPKRGLDANDSVDHQKRDDQFGSNYKPPPEVTPFYKFFLNALDDFMLKILLGCAVLSIVIDMSLADADHRSKAWIEGFAIFVAVLVVSLVGSYNDWAKDVQFVKLQKLSQEKQKITVLRSGTEHEIGFNDIKVGDICKIRNGMDVPVDGIIYHASGVSISEAAMTGESDEMKKDSVEKCTSKKEEKLAELGVSKEKPSSHSIPSPLMLSGTQVATGEGWFVCTVVGENSAIGQIMKNLEAEDEETPLQKKLEIIATDIGKLGMYAALLTVHVLYIRFFAEAFTDRSMAFGDEPLDYIREWLRYIVVGVTIVVVAVPEGLPLAVMISLAFSVKKMLIDQNFVKKLASCEIMGGANNICSDKTGTLTQNKMNVTDIWAGKEVSLNTEQNLKGVFKWEQICGEGSKVKELLMQGLTCNTTGTVDDSSATEKAMLLFMDGLGVQILEKRKQHLVADFVRFHFTSKRKKMGTILTSITDNEYGYDKRVHLKGASEIVLGNCTKYMNQDGHIVELDDGMKQHLLKIIESYAERALRTICLAYKDLKANEGGPDHEEVSEIPELKQANIRKVEETGFVCYAILGIKDVIRPEVPDAVKQCKAASIKVRMVTGDNKITAKAISKECNIYESGIPDDLQVMEGPAFFEKVGGLYCKNCTKATPCLCAAKDVKEGVRIMSEFKPIRENLRVLARSRPEDKYLLVTGLRELDDVVAVTGDGTNDAPALKKADVGFAMGIAGTDVAKHAADIILLDDNFSSIVKACMWGRNIYDNIRRFLQFQLTVNVVALISAFIGACILKESPLQPIQLLWVNLIMDSLGSLALATEPPTKELLMRKPQSRDEYIVSRKMVKHILGMSVYQCIIMFTVIFAGEKFINEYDSKYNLNDYNWTADKLKEVEKSCKDFNSAAYNGDPRTLPGGEWIEKDMLFPGRRYDLNNDPIYKCYGDVFGPSRHMSVVFNIFVYMQVFNMINARKIHDEINIFKGIHRNMLFLVIWAIIAGFQFLIATYFGDLFEVTFGLNGQQWMFSLVLGFGTFIVDFLLKFLPDAMCPELGKKTGEEEAAKHKDGQVRKSSSTMHRRVSQRIGSNSSR